MLIEAKSGKVRWFLKSWRLLIGWPLESQGKKSAEGANGGWLWLTEDEFAKSGHMRTSSRFYKTIGAPEQRKKCSLLWWLLSPCDAWPTKGCGSLGWFFRGTGTILNFSHLPSALQPLRSRSIRAPLSLCRLNVSHHPRANSRRICCCFACFSL